MEITWRHNYLGKKLIKEIKIIYTSVAEVLWESAQTGTQQLDEFN